MTIDAHEAAPDAVASAPATPGSLLRGARAALAFLTRLPVGGHPYAAADARWAAGWFPAVGLLVGALAAAAWLAVAAAGPLVAAAVAVVASLLVTGALHEDGLADTADALGGAPAGDRERLFAILKDSRIGVFGAAALVMALMLRVALLARLEAAAPLALVLVHAASRLPPVWLLAALPYVTPVESARSRPVAGAGGGQVALATGFAAAAVAAAVAAGRLGWPAALALGGAGSAVALVGGWRFSVRAGGVTGDFLGATQQAAECAMLLALALALAAG